MTRRMKTRAVIYDGQKATRIDDFPAEAWTRVMGGSSAVEAFRLWGSVAWLYRCVDVRATTASTMPWELTKGKNVVATHDTPLQDLPLGLEWMVKFPEYTFKVEAATALLGQAYLGRQSNQFITKGLKWLKPTSVKPVFNKKKGEVIRFIRHTDEGQVPLKVQDVVYFWPPDITVELGPAVQTPGQAALQAAGVIHSHDFFLSGYFDRGMIQATLLKYSEAMDEDEAQDLKDWWSRVFNGVKNAFTTEVVRADITTETIGEGLKDIQNDRVLTMKREDVATAMGVPQSKVTANAANYATKKGDDISFIEDTMGPRMAWAAGVWNELVFNPLGFHLSYRPDQLSALQEDEVARSGALANLRNAGLGLQVSLDTLGYDIPEGVPLTDVDPAADGEDQEEGPAEGQADPDMALAGGQISGALAIIEAFHGDKIDRDGAITLLVATLGFPPDVAQSIVPQEAKAPVIPPALAQAAGLDGPEEEDQDEGPPPMDEDKSAELGRLARWLKNRKGRDDWTWDEFQTDILSTEEVQEVAIKTISGWAQESAAGELDDIPDMTRSWEEFQAAMATFKTAMKDMGLADEEE